MIIYTLELRRLHGTNVELIENEILLMETESKHILGKRSIPSILSDPSLRLPIILVCVMLGGQQLSGVTMVSFYSVPMFQKAGLSSQEAKWGNLCSAALMLATASFDPLIMAKINRRPVIMASCFLCGISIMLLMVVVKFIVSLLKTFIVNKEKCIIYLKWTYVFQDYASWLPFTSIVVVCVYTMVFEIGLGAIPDFIGSGNIIESQNLFK